jgi:hypothetical protein
MPSSETASARTLRHSLVFVWIVTALVSVLELDGQSSALLRQAGWSDPVAIRAVILGGAAVDLLLGLGMALRPGRPIYAIALSVMILMTLTATVLLPALWLHPLGPLTKNIPVAACLWVLMRGARHP